MENSARLDARESTVRCSGLWTASHLHDVEKALPAFQWPTGDIQIDLSKVEALDTSGSWLLHRTIRQLQDRGRGVKVHGADETALRLLALVASNSAAAGDPPKPHAAGLLETVGRRSSEHVGQAFEFLAFVGNLARVMGHTAIHPWRIRVSLVARELQNAGVNALPIVGLLAFLIGVVIAYQGGIVLRDYGANIYIADIVGLSTVRELAPLITAIIVAGRTGSAYTAQIGTMMVTEEVDALRSIGISPIEMLVLPKLIALVIAVPLLTVFADAMGLLGGLIMSSTMLDLNPATFIGRLAEALTLQSYLSGIGKAPVFAAIIATVGCFQGFRVFGGADSVGRQTTVSVVQSIFLVLVVDAAFSVAFSKLGI